MTAKALPPAELSGRPDRSRIPLASSWEPWWRSFARALRAEGCSPRTLDTYGEALALFTGFWAARGAVPQPAEVERRHVEEFVAYVHETRKASTAHNRYRSLKRFFNWLVDEDEIPQSPMERMRPPKLDDDPVPMLSRDELTAVLKACAGRAFDDRRDLALVRFLIDAGARRSEVASMSLEHTDLDQHGAVVLAKGGNLRPVFFGNKTARDLDRYLRMRALHAQADVKAFCLGQEHGLLTPLWLGQRGPLTADGLYHAVARRFMQAGVRAKSAMHVFRHTFAGEWRLRGGSEEGLMAAAGWQSHAMLLRYGKAAAQKRAQMEHSHLSLGDQL
jgi:site-specific recombinase XerD